MALTRLTRLFLLCALALIPRGLCAQGEEPGSDAFWRQALGGIVVGSPAAQSRSVVVALDSGIVRAYSASGRPLWSYSTPGRISPFLSRSSEGTSYFSRTNGMFLAVSRGGNELWRRNPGGPLSAEAVTGWDSRVFVPTGRRITCYTATGSLLWSRAFDERIAFGPRLDRDGGILLALADGEVMKIDPFGRVVRWKLRALPRAVLPVGQGVSARIMALHADGMVELLDPAEPGKLPYILVKLPAPPLAAASRGNEAAVVMGNGQVVLVSADDGKILWTGDSHIRMQGGRADAAAALFDERGIYVCSANGATGFSADGRRLWFTTLSNAGGIPSFSDDGVLYSGGLDWILYAWKLEDRSLGQMQSLYGSEPQAQASYGIAGSASPRPWAGTSFRYDDSEIRKQFGSIRRGLASGDVGENERAWTAYLMEIISAGYGSSGVSITLPPVQIPERAQALWLLARFGSAEIVPWLTSVFKRERDPVLKAAAAAAIGSIGIDTDGVAVQAFLDTVSVPELARDEQVMLAVTNATGALCRYSGPALSETAIRILTHLNGWGQPQSVRQQARRELDLLLRF